MQAKCWLTAGALMLSSAAAAQPSLEELARSQIKRTHVAGSVWMIEGLGGNIGVSAGEDGLLVIDDQYAGLAPKLKSALSELSPKPVRFVFNTHFHGDHTGGNEALAESGAQIVAHDNVRKRLSTQTVLGMLKISPQKAWPVITFDEEVEFHLNGDDIRVTHLPNAHTDGDCAVQFLKADVLHTGDTFVWPRFPIIDYASGGTLNGYVRAQERMLTLVGPHTKIIPGHGPLADRAALQATHDALAKIRDRIVALADQGKSLDEIKAAKPTAEMNAKWGSGPVKVDEFVDMAYRGYLAEKKAATPR